MRIPTRDGMSTYDEEIDQKLNEISSAITKLIESLGKIGDQDKKSIKIIKSGYTVFYSPRQMQEEIKKRTKAGLLMVRKAIESGNVTKFCKDNFSLDKEK